MSTSGTGNWYGRMVAAAKADPRKTGALAVLAAVLLVTGGRAVVGGRSSPASAATRLTVGGSRDQNSKQLPWGRGSLSNVMPGSGRAGKTAALQRWTEAPVGPVSRNLFAIRSEYFPVDGSRTGHGPVSGDGFWERLEKSLSVQADQRNKRENLIANFKAEAARLRLESTAMGPVPKAMINGELVGEGGVVASFRVEKIEARRVIVEREGIRLEILMK